jgi:hypothetical protein
LRRIRLDDGPASGPQTGPPKPWAHQAGTQCCSVPPSIRKINSKGTAVLNAQRAGNRGEFKRRPLKTTPVLGLKSQTNSEIGNNLPRARAEQGGPKGGLAARCPSLDATCFRRFSILAHWEGTPRPTSRASKRTQRNLGSPGAGLGPPERLSRTAVIEHWVDCARVSAGTRPANASTN